jgi:hypothetical protein
MSTAWDSPSADPFGDLRRYADLIENAPAVTKIEVNYVTLDALHRARSDAERDTIFAGTVGLWWSVPVVADVTVPDRKARLTWSDGRVEVVP